MSRKKNEFRKDQHVLCRYNGDNGDLIVGRIESVRKNGDVILTNLLSGNKSVKKASVLSARNCVVIKKNADAVVKCAKEHGTQKARELAVATVHDLELEKHEEVRSVKVQVLDFKKKCCSNDCTWKNSANYCTLFNEGLDKCKGDAHFVRRSDCVASDITKGVQLHLPLR
jgi:hypothetical protein